MLTKIKRIKLIFLTHTALFTRRGATAPSQPATLSLLIHGETIRASEAMIDADFLRRKRGRRAATEERARTTDGETVSCYYLGWRRSAEAALRGAAYRSENQEP